MTKLSDTQALILSAAAQRLEHIALPLPESLRGGAAAKVVGAMLAKGFLEEVDADTRNSVYILPSLDTMVRMVATLGGFLNRKNDGFPGPKTLWIGLQRIPDFVLALAAQRSIGESYG
jgi:hypothetical protein